MFTKETVSYHYNPKPDYIIHCYRLSTGKWWSEISRITGGFLKPSFDGDTEEEVLQLAGEYIEKI